MNQQIYKVMSRRIQMKQRVIDLMRNPGQRMPVCLLGSGKRPNDSIPTQTLAHVQIVGHISRVIVVDKRMPVHLVIQQQCRDDDQQTHDDVALLGRSEQSLRRGWRRGSFLFCGSSQWKNLNTLREADTDESAA